jgi:hypothetical protein
MHSRRVEAFVWLKAAQFAGVIPEMPEALPGIVTDDG